MGNGIRRAWRGARGRVTTAIGAALLVAPLAALPAPVQAQGRAELDIPAGRLSSSIRILARQAGISIATRESGVRQFQAKAVRGALSPAEALRRLLAGTPYRAVAIPGGFRIEKRAPAQRSSSSARAPRQNAAPPPAPAPPIIVEGTKRAFAASDYPGGVKRIAVDDLALRRSGESLDSLLADVPSVNGTALGSGRNKVFLRGIADSSFNGPTQATIGLYLGEQRLIFSAPNPDLRLYDTQSVELLEGPQGTLYGAGTIAGLVRANPRAPDASGVEAEGWLAGGATRDGGYNWSSRAMANLPVGGDSALRLVGYGGEDSGFIDDPARGLTDINQSSHYGGRAALAFGVGADWDVTLSGFGQHNRTRDGQYIDGALEGLQRTDRVRQPFRGRIYGGALTVRGALGKAELTSTTGFVDHALRSVFDSSRLNADGPDNPMQPTARQAFRENREIRLITHETRLSGGDPEALSWLVGASALRNRDRMRQTFNTFDASAPPPPPFANLTYRLDEFALFGEASHAFAQQWSLTAGARLLYTSASGERSFGPDTVIEPRDGPVRLLPALALSWQPDEAWTAYIRAQQGFRTGGVTIERDTAGDPQTAQFDPDKVRSYEAGVRGRFGTTTPIEVALTLYRSDWRDVQADLLDRQGFPITRNIGDGTVTGLDGSARLRTGNGWDLSLAAAWNDSDIDRLLPEGGVRRGAIPNVPDVSAGATLSKVWSVSQSSDLGAALSGRYLGRSFLDIDQRERIEQGDFGTLDVALWWEREGLTVRLEALNLTNTRGNRFAFGNPFTVRTEDQVTPVRPFTVQFQLTVRR